MSSKYIKIGLRADKNLSDILDPKVALENILNDISVSGSGFKAEDLLIINGIRNKPITDDQFLGLDGLVQQYSVPGNHFFTLDTTDVEYDTDALLGKEFTIASTNAVIDAKDITVTAPGAPFFDARSGNGTIVNSGGILTINFPNTTHNFASGIQVQYSYASGTLTSIPNLTENQILFVHRVDANNIQFAFDRAAAIAGANLIGFAGEGESDKRHIFTSLVKWEVLDGSEYKTTMSGTGVIKAFDRPSVYAEVKAADFFDVLPENGKFTVDITDIENTPITRSIDVLGLSTFTSEVFDVVPLITLQDNITNFKVILGDPPYIGGGDGPNAFFFSSDRINNGITESVTGRSGTATDRASLATNELFTRYQRQSTDPVSLLPVDVIGPEFFWDNGVFEFQSKIKNTFPDSFGGVQWIGYVAEDFNFDFVTTGLLIFEENPNNSSDPSVPSTNEQDFVIKKSIYAPSRTVTCTADVTFDGTSSSTISYGDDIIYVAVGDLVTVGTLDSTIESDRNTLAASTFVVETVNNITGAVTVSGDLTNPLGTVFTHYWPIGRESVNTGNISISRPPLGGRTQIRITVWWPDPTDLGIEIRDIREKTFETDTLGTDRRPFYEMYSTFNPSQVFSEFSYKAFEDNRAKATNQKVALQNSGDSTFIQSNGTFLIDYTPPINFTDVYFDEILATNKGDGRFVVNDATFPALSNGDWLAADVGGVNESYQIIETFTDPSVETETDVVFYIPETSGAATTALETQVTFSAFKNLGLIGVYDLAYTSATQGTITKLSAGAVDDTNYDPEYVLADYLVCSFDPSNATPAGQNFARISAVGNFQSNSRTITITDNYSNGSQIVNATGRLALVYSNTGLRDLSQVANCVGVYGKEVTDVVSAGSTNIFLTNLDGISASPTTGDFVQFEGAGSSPIIPEFSTRVSSTTTYSQAATSIDDNGSATITVTSASHGLSPGDSVVITGASDVTLNGRYDIATTATDTFTISDSTGLPIVAATGIIERYNIVLSASTVGADIPKNATLVFIDGTLSPPTENKEFCVIPLNTAPPFEGISTGLKTPIATPNVEANKFKFETLALGNTFVQDIQNPTDTANTFIKIVSNGTTYNILAKS